MKIQTKNFMKFGLLAFALLMLLSISIAVYTDRYSWIGDALLSFVFLSAFYVFRRFVRLTPFGFSLIFFALIVHNFGVFGFYSREFFGLGFDHYTHFFGNLALAVVLYIWLSNLKSLRGRTVSICGLVILSVLGAGAMVEMVEFLGYMYLNTPFANVFFPGNAPLALLTPEQASSSMDYFNTMVDMIYNLIGAVAGCVLMSARKIRF